MMPVNGSFKLIPPTRNIVISWKIRRVLAYIDGNYHQTIRLSDVGMRFGIHPDYLCRKFKRELGFPFHEYILRIRIQKAATLLVDSGKSIKEISYEVGFSRPEIFSKAFKRLTGRSPKDYRSQSPFVEALYVEVSSQVPLSQENVAPFRSIQTYLDVKK